MPATASNTTTSEIIAEGRSGLLRVLETFARSLGHSDAPTIDAMRKAASCRHDELAGLLGRRGFEQAQDLTASRISLVDDEALTFTLALSQFARDIRDRCERLLGQLHLRYMTLLERDDATTELIPVGPDTVCHALQALADAKAMTPDERALLIEQADQALSQELAKFYTAFDDRLARAGVRLKALGRPAAEEVRGGPVHLAGTSETATGPATSDPDASPASSLTRLQRLLMSRRGRSEAEAVVLAPELAASIMAQIRAWLAVQQQSESAAPRLASSNLVHLLAPESAVAVETLEQLFEGIANHPELPPAIKHTIARLQIPLLKRALDDDRLLATPEHPARALIDAIAQAGNSLPFAQDGHAGYQRIDSIVRGTLHEGELDDERLDAARSELDALVARRRQIAVDAAERAVETAGRAERREGVRLFASRALGLFLDEQTAPAIRTFLTTYWIQVLVRTLYRLGNKHPDWRAQLDVANELVLSARPDANGFLPAERAAALPGLIARIEAALAANGLDRSARTHALAECVALHAALITGKTPASPPHAARGASELVLSQASEDPGLGMLHHIGYNSPMGGAPARLSELEADTWVELELPDGTRLHGYVSWIGPTRKAILLADPDSGRRLVATMRAIADLMRENRFRVRDVSSLTETVASTLLDRLAP